MVLQLLVSFIEIVGEHLHENITYYTIQKQPWKNQSMKRLQRNLRQLLVTTYREMNDEFCIDVYIYIYLFCFSEEACGPCNLKGDPLLVCTTLFPFEQLCFICTQAGPQPPFETETQDYPGLESKMNPRPDYGYRSYGGNERLKGKVAIITGE